MEHLACIRMVGRLRRLLTRSPDGDAVSYRFDGHPAVKDAIEALGVPHTEVAAIAIDGRSVSFAEPLYDGMRVEVYPHGCTSHLAAPVRLRPPPPPGRRFVLDVHLGKLARRLRLLGFDCFYRNDSTDAELVDIACRDERIVLTRDRGLLKRKKVVWGCLLDAGTLREQVMQVDARFGVLAGARPLSRCPNCNGLLRPVEKHRVRDRLEPKTLRHHDLFRMCGDCRQIYWHGSHVAKILQWLDAIRLEKELNGSDDDPGTY